MHTHLYRVFLMFFIYFFALSYANALVNIYDSYDLVRLAHARRLEAAAGGDGRGGPQVGLGGSNNMNSSFLLSTTSTTTSPTTTNGVSKGHNSDLSGLSFQECQYLLQTLIDSKKLNHSRDIEPLLLEYRTRHLQQGRIQQQHQQQHTQQQHMQQQGQQRQGGGVINANGLEEEDLERL